MKKYTVATIAAISLVLVLSGCRRNGTMDETTAPVTMPSETIPGDVTHAATNPPASESVPEASDHESQPDLTHPDDFASNQPTGENIPRSRRIPARR